LDGKTTAAHIFDGNDKNHGSLCDILQDFGMSARQVR
jgi:hypothetical protein